MGIKGTIDKTLLPVLLDLVGVDALALSLQRSRFARNRSETVKRLDKL